jgi:hypothetical protein
MKFNILSAMTLIVAVYASHYEAGYPICQNRVDHPSYGGKGRAYGNINRMSV